METWPESWMSRSGIGKHLAGAQAFEHVVEAGHGELGAGVEPGAAQGVEFLGDGVDGGALCGGGVGERRSGQSSGSSAALT